MFGGDCSNLGFLYYNGKGVRQDHIKANELFKKACDLEDGFGCGLLGIAYLNGAGVRQNN